MQCRWTIWLGVPLARVGGSRRLAALAEFDQIEFLQAVVQELLGESRTRMGNKPHKDGSVWLGLQPRRGWPC